MFNKALVPLDESELAEGILPYVSQIARGMDMPLVLLTVIDPDAVELPSRLRLRPAASAGGAETGQPQAPQDDDHPYPQVLEGAEAQAREQLESVARRLRQRGVEAQVTVAFGRPADEIIETAQREGCDLITMSTHGRNPLGRAVLGSVTDKVIHSSHIPTLALAPEQGHEYQEQGQTIESILVPLDGSPLAETALPYVEALAAKMSLQIMVARAVTRDTLQLALTGGYADIGDPAREVDRYVTDYLNGVTNRLRQKGLKADWKILWGHPAASIVELAHTLGHDMIALTTHGRSGIRRWALGSVAEAVVRASGRPVLVIPPTAADAKQH